MTFALDTNQARNLGVGALITVLVVGIVLSLVISAIVGRIVVLVIAVGVGLLIWNQRAAIQDAARKCDAKFFGVHLSVKDPALKKQCQDVTNR